MLAVTAPILFLRMFVLVWFRMTAAVLHTLSFIVRWKLICAPLSIPTPEPCDRPVNNPYNNGKAHVCVLSCTCQHHNHLQHMCVLTRSGQVSHGPPTPDPVTVAYHAMCTQNKTKTFFLPKTALISDVISTQLNTPLFAEAAHSYDVTTTVRQTVQAIFDVYWRVRGVGGRRSTCLTPCITMCRQKKLWQRRDDHVSFLSEVILHMERVLMTAATYSKKCPLLYLHPKQTHPHTRENSCARAHTHIQAFFSLLQIH